MSRRDQIEALNDKLSEAISANDIATLASFYAEDAKLLPPGHPIVEGREAIEARFNQFANTTTSMNFDFTLVDVIEAGDIVVDISKMKVSSERKDGETMGHDAKHLLVWKEKADGELEILVEVINRDA